MYLLYGICAVFIGLCALQWGMWGAVVAGGLCLIVYQLSLWSIKLATHEQTRKWIANHKRLRFSSRLTNNSRLNFFLWWRVDPQELNNQILNYKVLGWKSARRISALLLWVSMALTGFYVSIGALGIYSLADVILSGILSIFVFRGYKWASMAAMIFWTLEKFYSMHHTLTTSSDTLLISSLLWWTAYMHVFYLSYRVGKDPKTPNSFDGHEDEVLSGKEAV